MDGSRALDGARRKVPIWLTCTQSVQKQLQSCFTHGSNLYSALNNSLHVSSHNLDWSDWSFEFRSSLCLSTYSRDAEMGRSFWRWLHRRCNCAHEKEGGAAKAKKTKEAPL